jgi:hypothetical protein
MRIDKALPWIAATLTGAFAGISATAIAFLLFALATNRLKGGESSGDPLLAIPGIVIMLGTPFAMLYAAVIGLPVALLLRAKQRTGITIGFAAGFALGALPIGVVVGSKPWPVAVSDYLALAAILLLCGCAGMAGTWTFRRVLVWCGVPLHANATIPAAPRHRALIAIGLAVAPIAVAWGVLLAIGL